jgi:hypothetical protein
MGNSGVNPKPATESRFVADEGPGFDVPHAIVSSGDVVSVLLHTTRVVGTVDADGFFEQDKGLGLLHLGQGTLADPLVLTVRARIMSRDAGGVLGLDDLDVEVVLNRGIEGRELHLPALDGPFGGGEDEWWDFRLDVPVLAVAFPADPCLGEDPSEPCGSKAEPRANGISFVFTGSSIQPGAGLTFEIDWITLEPKDKPGLAWRPVLLAHGWRGRTFTWTDDGWAWGPGLRKRDIGFYAVELDRYGTIRANGSEITAAVTDLKDRFGVERVNVVGFCKGGLDAREHVRQQNDVDTLVMLATPNLGSFEMEATPPEALQGLVSTAEADPITGAEVDPKQVARSARELTSSRMSRYNRDRKQNPRTVYVAAAVDHDSPAAVRMRQTRGANDEFVSVASVFALPYAAQEKYGTSINDPQNQTCLLAKIGAHTCLLTYPSIVDDLFDKYLAKLTPPQSGPSSADGPAGLARENVADATAGPAVEDVAAVVQGVGSDAALIPADGVTQAHAVLIDAADAAQFEVIVDGDLVRLELVSPSGRRIDAATPQTDPAVIHAPLLDQGPFSVTGYHIQAPEPGTWTLEVTGTGVPAPDTGYAVTALVQLAAGSGVVLAAAVDPDQGVVDDPVTITATVTADGLPVTDATVRAEVFHPDGDTTTEVALVDDGTGGDAVAGNGIYSGDFAASSLTGDYDVVVSAEGPTFTREEQLDFAVVPSATTFSGSFSDRGVDTDGDGRFDQLVVEVGVEVDVEAAYRVFGTLRDGAETAIEQLRVEQQLAPGPQTVSLAFDGALLFALGHDGPYLLEDLVIEDVATLTGLAVGPAYTTAAYAHTDFQRPPLLLTGNASDHGAHTVHMERLPFEELVVEVEVDSFVAADVQAAAKLYAEDGTFVAADNPLSSLEPRLVVVAFRFPADQIFRVGKPGPYTLQLFSIWGTAADGTAVSLQAPRVVAVTQPYRLEDFAESPRFTVGGTVTGLVGAGLELELSTEGPPGTPATTTLRRSGNGPFTFSFPQLVSGNPYEVRVKTQPTNPVQVCTVTNASGTIEDTNATNVEVHCV